MKEQAKAQNKAAQNPDGYYIPKRTDRIQELPELASLNRSRMMGLNLKLLGWLRECSPDRAVSAVTIGRNGAEVLLFPAQVGDPDAQELRFSKTATAVRFLTSVAIRKSEVPTVAGGTLKLTTVKKQLPSGTWCLSMHVTEPQEEHKENAPKKKRKKSKSKNNSGAASTRQKKNEKTKNDHAADEAAAAAAKAAAAAEAAKQEAAKQEAAKQQQTDAAAGKQGEEQK